MHAAVVFVALAIAGLAWALATGDLTYRYVASWSSSYTPLPYRLGAVWAGPSGALLLWAFALGAGASTGSATLARGSSLRAWTGALLALLLVAVLAMACFDSSPFLRLAFAPDDGRGLPLEWVRPVVLVQMPLGYIAMALVSVPAVMTVMGAIGRAPWQEAARRWALATWALAGAAMLFDWRRRYGDAAWSEDWRWAPVHAGTAFAWAGASLLVIATTRRWRVNASLGAAFAAFTLALVGLTMRRAFGWDGVHDFAASAVGRAAAWLTLALVMAGAVDAIRATRGVRRRSALAMRIAHGALIVVAAALVVVGFTRTQTVDLREGERSRVSDRFGTAWTLSLEGVSTVGRENVIANVIAVRAAAKGRGSAFVTAEVRSLYSGAANEPVDQLIVSGVSAGLLQDLRLDVREATNTDAVVDVRFVPIATWLWIAGAVAVLAALVAALSPMPGDESATGEPSTVDAGVPSTELA
jgi:cytochrome c biogenesis factor